ncbi:MAG TPA: MarR family transcriptional regulator [Spirochaetia bacterium]|nr:MarR family transcriptional regulator [Spirochaetia bacterium]
MSRSRIRRAVAAWLRLARFVNSQGHLLGALLRDHKLSEAQFDVIAQIGVSEGLTQKELADRLVVTQGNVTQLLQKLERQGLVERPPSGRCNRLRLTAAGRRIRDATVPVHERAIAGLFRGLTDSELEMLSRLLRRITHEQPVEDTLI